MFADSKSTRLVTTLVECRPDGEYVPWGIKWYDGAVYLFKEIESYTPRSWARAALDVSGHAEKIGLGTSECELIEVK